jgi:methylmalonyl-CoA/ethylmalonyl-CoA epimerase
MTIGQIGLTVSDLGRGIAFYRDVVGLPLLFEAPNAAFFNCGDARLMLGLSHTTRDNSRNGTIVYFKIPDIAATAAVLKEHGVAFETEPHLVARMMDHELWMAFFHDPDGNKLALMCEKR